MRAIKINNKKDFMSKLLIQDLFDLFLVEEAVIDTFNSFHIDGHIHREFYANDPEYSEDDHLSFLSSWSDLKPICYDLIKGKRTPLGFKFVFHADDNLKSSIISGADEGFHKDQVTLGLNIRFSNSEVILTTGTAFSIFTLDKTIEKAWDDYIPSFLEKSGISCETL